MLEVRLSILGILALYCTDDYLDANITYLTITGTSKLTFTIMIIIRTLEICPQCQAYSLSKQRFSTRYYERPTLVFMTTHNKHHFIAEEDKQQS